MNFVCNFMLFWLLSQPTFKNHSNRYSFCWEFYASFMIFFIHQYVKLKCYITVIRTIGYNFRDFNTKIHKEKTITEIEDFFLRPSLKSFGFSHNIYLMQYRQIQNRTLLLSLSHCETSKISILVWEKVIVHYLRSHTNEQTKKQNKQITMISGEEHA